MPVVRIEAQCWCCGRADFGEVRLEHVETGFEAWSAPAMTDAQTQCVAR